MVDRDFRRRVRDWGRDERADNLIRKSVVGRRPGTTQFFWDDKVPGFGLKITANNHESFVYQYRPEGHRFAKRITFKGVHSVAQARALAADVAAGRHHEAAERPIGNPETLREVVDAYMAARGSKFKSAREFERSLRNHVLPTLGDRPYESITRRDLGQLVLSIAAKRGPSAAHIALQNLNTIWNKFYCNLASDGWSWPKITSPLEQSGNGNGKKKLTDDEIRAIWAATTKLPAQRGAYVRFLFYTGIRRTAEARITRDQLHGDVLHIPGDRTKPAYELPLSAPALALLHAHWGERWAFQPLGGFHLLKLDKHLQERVRPWTLHWIRHTARSLLSRAGVHSDIGELALGHALRGMQKLYDHHDYELEKAQAMEKLAEVVLGIVG